MKELLTKKEKQTIEMLGLSTLKDVLEYYPFRYETVQRTLYKDWKKDGKVTFEGKIISEYKIARYGKKSAIRFDCLVEEQYVIHCTIFNRIWLSKIPLGTTITIFGKYDGYDKVTMTNYNTISLNEQEGILPVYNLKEGISLKYFANLVKKAILNEKADSLIPESKFDCYKLMSKDQAIREIHFPRSLVSLHNAKRTLKYEEFLKFETLVYLRRKENIKEDASFIKSFDYDEVFSLANNNLPFALTTDQIKALNDILDDMSQPKSMFRLIQGDVGCGKTVVAALALYANALSNKQGAFMVPTEILAIQQYEELKKLFLKTSTKVACLYSSMDTKEKRQVLHDLQDGSIDIIVGTHALIQDTVVFKDLGLVVTDEQHRFGVKQRAKLNEKGNAVDVLIMSATPIPRTLASVLYGDSEISYIKTQPANRKPVITKLINNNSIMPIYDELVTMLEEDSKAYIVCPMIDENDEIRNVTGIYNALKKEFKDRFEVSLLHGRMLPEEKESILKEFKDGNTKILISTTVIEVGVNVKEANIMIIYNSDRFGLSQLHQLRGRVKRGSKQGYCYLLTDSKDESSLQRLKALEDNEDGFEIADIDMKYRGFGDLFGQRQSGLPSFKIGNIETDLNIIRAAQKDAEYICKNPSEEDKALLDYCKNYLENVTEID